MAMVEFPIDGGGSVFVQDADENSGLTRVGAGDRIAKATVATWNRALDGMRLAAEGALVQLRQIEPAPDEVEVTFAVAVDGKVGAKIVTGGSAAHMNVKVVWRRPEPTPTEGPDGPT